MDMVNIDLKDKLDALSVKTLQNFSTQLGEDITDIKNDDDAIIARLMQNHEDGILYTLLAAQNKSDYGEKSPVFSL